MKKHIYIIFILLIVSASFAQSKKTEVKGPYFGQKPPGATPEIFAPGIVSTENFEHSSPTFSPDGKEVYWSRMDLPLTHTTLHKIYYSKIVDDKWTIPKVASFSGLNSDDGPKFSYDGWRIYFYSRKPYGEANAPMPYHDIYYTDRKVNEWGKPVKISSVINTPEIESSVSITKNEDVLFAKGGKNNFYFARKNGILYTEPMPVLDDSLNITYLNITPFINKEGNVLLFGSVNRPDGLGACDLYVSFLQKDGKWSAPKNLGDKINTGANERFPSLSPDGKYLFFVSNRSIEKNIGKQDVPQNGLGDIYWVDAKVIEELRPDNF